MVLTVWALLCDWPFLFLACSSSVHHHHLPLPVCGDVWWHGSWCADDMCCPLPGHPRKSPPCPEERQWGTVTGRYIHSIVRCFTSEKMKYRTSQSISILQSVYQFFCRCSTWCLLVATSSCWWGSSPSTLASFITTASPNHWTCLALDGVSGPCLAPKEPTGRKF